MTPSLLHTYYPFALALLGAVASAAITQRALRRLPPNEKGVLFDSFARGRIAVLSMVAIVVALLFWRPFVAWLFFALAETCLFGISWLRIGRLNISKPTRMTLRLSNFYQTLGFVICGVILATRLSA